MATKRKGAALGHDAGRDPGASGGHLQLRVLSDEGIQRIHEAVLDILENVGIKVARQHIIDMMGDAGCRVDGDIVRIPRRLVESAIASAPGQIQVYNREGEPAMLLGGPEVYTHTGYTPLEFFDIDTGERRPYTLDDYRLVCRVADGLPNVDGIGQPGVCRPSRENPLEVINHLEFEAMMTYSSKPLYTLVASGEILEDCLEMAEAVAVANGAKSLREKPFVVPMLNVISPLVFNDETCDKLDLAVKWGIPVICGPMPLAGGTAPVTMAATIAQSTAESLAGLVITQIKQPGHPYVMITFASSIDMRTGDVRGGPEGLLMVAGCLEMGHHYGIPISGGGVGGGYRGILDAESGWQQMLGGLMRLLMGGNAGIMVGAGSSLEAAVMADELIGMLRHMVKGVPVNDETLALDAIRDVGAGGGTFLGHPHTFRHFREHWQGGLTPSMRYEDWVAAGSWDMGQRVKQRMRHIMATHQPKPLPEAAKKTIAAIIARARARARAAA